jgi:cytochrome c-type biogenesis protein CcmH/NrfF
VRFGRSKWFNLLWLLPIGFLVLIVGVAVAFLSEQNPQALMADVVDHDVGCARHGGRSSGAS